MYWKEGESKEVKRWGFLSETALPRFLSLTISHPRLHPILALFHPAGSTRLASTLPFLMMALKFVYLDLSFPCLSIWLGCLSQIPNRLSRSRLKVKELLLCHERDIGRDKTDERRNECLAGVFVTMLRVSGVTAASNVVKSWAEKKNTCIQSAMPRCMHNFVFFFAFQFCVHWRQLNCCHILKA